MTDWIDRKGADEQKMMCLPVACKLPPVDVRPAASSVFQSSFLLALAAARHAVVVSLPARPAVAHVLSPPPLPGTTLDEPLPSPLPAAAPLLSALRADSNDRLISGVDYTLANLA